MCLTIIQVAKMLSATSLPVIRATDHGVLVIMEWTNDNTANDESTVGYQESDEESNEESNDGGADSSSDSSDSREEESDVPHTVLFKCIGAVRDSRSQDTLRLWC